VTAFAWRARVVSWPAPWTDGPADVYSVRVTGGTPGARDALAAAAREAGLRVDVRQDALVCSGAPSAFAQVAHEAAAGMTGALDRFRMPPRALEARGVTLDLRDDPLIVGILNVTPDSFYDGGRYVEREAGLAGAEEMVAEGAGMIEVGGETARPGPPIGVDEETRRVIPVIETLAGGLRVPVSVETYKPDVARRAIEAGAVLINDISGLADIRLAEVAAETGAALVVMHIQGRPKVRQLSPRYRSVVDEVYAFLEDRTRQAQAAGVAASRLVIDPGFSFGKAPHHDVEILRRLGEFRSLGYPLYLATSRKNYIRDLLGLPVDDLLEGTAAAVAYGVAQGARLVRTHDVRFMTRVARMVEAIVGPPTELPATRWTEIQVGTPLVLSLAFNERKEFCAGSGILSKDPPRC